VKFDVGGVRKIYREMLIFLISDKNIGHFTWTHNYVYTVDSSAKYFVARWQVLQEAILAFICQQFNIVNNYM